MISLPLHEKLRTQSQQPTILKSRLLKKFYRSMNAKCRQNEKFGAGQKMEAPAKQCSVSQRFLMTTYPAESPIFPHRCCPDFAYLQTEIWQSKSLWPGIKSPIPPYACLRLVRSSQPVQKGWFAAPLDDLVQAPHDALGGQREVDFDA
ncbi:MAG: hypothetical protein ACI9HB_001945, partial [Gammaproteobacteria bacterium]